MAEGRRGVMPVWELEIRLEIADLEGKLWAARRRLAKMVESKESA